jgi:cobalt transporter subunit CbtB
MRMDWQGASIGIQQIEPLAVRHSQARINNGSRMEEIKMRHFESEISTVDKSLTRELVGTRWVSGRIIAAVVAIALGMTIISVVGFAPNDFIHAAAHDVRHSAGFPCH